MTDYVAVYLKVPVPADAVAPELAIFGRWMTEHGVVPMAEPVPMQYEFATLADFATEIAKAIKAGLIEQTITDRNGIPLKGQDGQLLTKPIPKMRLAVLAVPIDPPPAEQNGSGPPQSRILGADG